MNTFTGKSVVPIFILFVFSAPIFAKEKGLESFGESSCRLSGYIYRGGSWLDGTERWIKEIWVCQDGSVLEANYKRALKVGVTQ